MEQANQHNSHETAALCLSDRRHNRRAHANKLPDRCEHNRRHPEAMTTDARLYAPSTARNIEPISNLLQPLLPQRGLVLEIASGAGEHITHLAELSNAGLVFQPSDPGDVERASADAWAHVRKLPNVRPAINIDAAAAQWPIDQADVIFCINMIHISLWAATVGLMRNAARILPPGGMLFTYGPYRRDGTHTSDSNAAFDESLRQRNPEWGIRDVGEITDLAQFNGLQAPEIIQMPANNLSLIFRR